MDELSLIDHNEIMARLTLKQEVRAPQLASESQEGQSQGDLYDLRCLLKTDLAKRGFQEAECCLQVAESPRPIAAPPGSRQAKPLAALCTASLPPRCWQSLVASSQRTHRHGPSWRRRDQQSRARLSLEM